jgi:hypothetical protein
MATIYGNRGDFIALVGNMGQPALVRSVKRAMLAGGDLPIVSANAPRSIPGIDYSDHLNYWAFGYPAVMLTDTLRSTATRIIMRRATRPTRSTIGAWRS